MKFNSSMVWFNLMGLSLLMPMLILLFNIEYLFDTICLIKGIILFGIYMIICGIMFIRLLKKENKEVIQRFIKNGNVIE